MHTSNRAYTAQNSRSKGRPKLLVWSKTGPDDLQDLNIYGFDKQHERLEWERTKCACSAVHCGLRRRCVLLASSQMNTRNGQSMLLNLLPFRIPSRRRLRRPTIRKFIKLARQVHYRKTSPILTVPIPESPPTYT